MSSQDSTPPARVPDTPGAPRRSARIRNRENMGNVQRRLSFSDVPQGVQPVAAPAPVDDAPVAQPAPLAQAAPVDDANIPAPPPPPLLHRSHACTYQCEGCGEPTSNDCHTCSECPCPPNCGNPGGHRGQQN